MPPTADQIFNEALALPLDVRAELVERLVSRLAEDIPEEIVRAQLSEVQRRIAQVESGEVQLIPGEAALAKVRRVLGDRKAANE